MSDVKNPPPYTIPVESQSDVKVYHVHTPFNPIAQDQNPPQNIPIYTSGGGGLSSGFDDGKKKFTSYDTALGYNSGMTTCPSCQQQVMTNVTYKPGTYAWLMVLLFICLGLVLCCCLLPLLFKKFKDAHHTCPRCNRLLHVEKRKCCE
ncbi:lipopolysaccharide-induced tumor necrosis factor-alpha factor homolog-like [Phycodurus eques]|uniref:lipopolysaccharide-induced tumor necrosis factor-alpha factor homolog-like n=1 Tax=Phycodurus eques TaxID=693459 RepID=UPI002ACEDE72|nr:lipopolysaccharide-induced tumor necrosis factor-alpha factor homolog-like [Phycodurus eques]